jgi:urease accessory protein
MTPATDTTLGFGHFIAQSDVVGKTLLVLLLLMSAASWALILAKGVAQALRAWQTHDVARLQSLNQWVLQTRESAEFRLQTEQMGRSLLEWLRNQGDANDPRLASCAALSPTWPLAFGLALAQHHAPEREGLLASAFGWAENMVQAAIKSVPLGQLAGQRILSRLTQEIPTAVDHALSLDNLQRQAFSPMLAILSAQHEHQYSRLFRS